jgi:16S rRNA (guanine966-N2)-methyltransferase
MRVIAGKYRSRAVKPPKDMKVRPTSDKVKGALFNMLEPLRGLSVVDFYSGTGNLGIEALSRGAEEVVFVENAVPSLKLIRENLESLGIRQVPGGAGARVMVCEVARAFALLHQEGRKFDILLADPPYGAGALKRVQSLLARYPILKEGGLLAVEHESGDREMDPDFPHALDRQKKYGDTLLSLFQNKGREAAGHDGHRAKGGL